jgi:hypothetical protein
MVGCDSEPANPTDAPSRSTPASPRAAPAPSTSAPPCEAGPLSNPATGAGDDLEIQILHQRGAASGWDIALPSTSVAAFPEFTGKAKATDTVTSFARAFDEGGAFSYDGAVVDLSIYNRRPSPATINNVRIVNKRRVCPPEGLLFLEGSEGGGDESVLDITFSLDAAAPIAHGRSEAGELETVPYFDSHAERIDPQEETTVHLDMSTVRFPYEFDIAIDYTAGGNAHTQIVRRRGGPFRVTTTLCPSPGLRASISDQDVQRLKAQHYDHVRRRLGETDSAGAYVYKNMSSSEYIESCASW